MNNYYNVKIYIHVKFLVQRQVERNERKQRLNCNSKKAVWSYDMVWQVVERRGDSRECVEKPCAIRYCEIMGSKAGAVLAVSCKRDFQKHVAVVCMCI